MSNLSFYDKYLKYKTKYINLKNKINQSGGDSTNDDFIMSLGSSPTQTENNQTEYNLKGGDAYIVNKIDDSKINNYKPEIKPYKKNTHKTTKSKNSKWDDDSDSDFLSDSDDSDFDLSDTDEPEFYE